MRVYSKRLVSGKFLYSSMPKMKNGWKYTLLGEMTVRTDIKPIQEYQEQFFSILMDKTIHFKSGYSWDGASGCTDHDSIMFGSCVHDACCQLYHRGIILKDGRVKADTLLFEIVKNEMKARANGHFWKKIWANIWPELVWVAVRSYSITQ